MLFELNNEQSDLTYHLQQKIASIINNTELKAISFSEYMNIALYDAEYGYYNNLLYKFGFCGDYVTSPIVSELFGKCIANQCIELVDRGVSPNILEIGAGNGQLMLDLLGELCGNTSNIKFENYYILELSHNLAKLQQQRLQEKFPHLIDRVVWLDKLPDKFDGIILGNEILDAQPCEVIKLEQNKIYSRYVGVSDDVSGFKYVDMPPTIELSRIASHLPCVSVLESTGGVYISEISLNNRGFMASLSEILNSGCILLIDYGYGENEYYSGSKHQGTLRGFFHHHVVDDVLIYPGLIDITASVDFTAVATVATHNGLDLIGYTTQANFLINSGLLNILQDYSSNMVNEVEYLKFTNQVNKLTSPNEMGTIFKVIGFSKNVSFNDWLGFVHGDLSYSL